MFIEPHFVGISPTQLSQRTGGPQQQGFINNYKVICFCVKIIWRVFSTVDKLEHPVVTGVCDLHLEGILNPMCITPFKKVGVCDLHLEGILN